jgi:hypothetical protein
MVVESNRIAVMENSLPSIKDFACGRVMLSAVT